MKKDLIFFLPGVLGSELHLDGEEVWSLRKMVETRVLSLNGHLDRYRSVFERLKLEKDDEALEDLGDGVTAPQVLHQHHHIPQWVPFFGKTNVYDDLIESLRHLAPLPGQFVPFPYDWRRSVRAVARKFARVAHEKLHLWRQQHGEDAKLFIVGHSLGGLIAEYYCELLQGWKDTTHLITLGTPHRGAVKPVRSLLQGHDAFSIDMLQSCTSMYHLTTPMAALETPNGPLCFKDAECMNSLHTSLEDGWNLYQELEQARLENSQDEAYQKFELSVVRATRHRTIQALSIDHDSSLVPLYETGSNSGGDGTIPAFASLPTDWNGTAIEVRQEHAWLANWSGAVSFVRDTWNGRRHDPKVYFGAPSLIDELGVPELLAVHHPLLVKVAAKAREDLIKVRLTHGHRRGTTKEFPFRGEDKTQLEWPEPLAHGDYRIDVWLDSESEKSALTSSVSVR